MNSSEWVGLLILLKSKKRRYAQVPWSYSQFADNESKVGRKVIKICWTVRSAGKYVHHKGERLPSFRLFDPSNRFTNERRATNSFNESVVARLVTKSKHDIRLLSDSLFTRCSNCE